MSKKIYTHLIKTNAFKIADKVKAERKSNKKKRR
tara:strand:- start:6440 stop:6541 length:102 start_codon:yes stop_codon:yes gene_type:complete